MICTLEILFLFFTPRGGAEKSKKEFREGTYTPRGGTEMSPVYRGLVIKGKTRERRRNIL